MSRRRNIKKSAASQSVGENDDATQVVRLKAYSYIHVLDNNTNVSCLEVGPQTYTVEQHEKVVLSESDFIVVPPRHYCRVRNPVVTTADGKPVMGKHKSVTIAHGEEEIRLARAPFPLYPGEQLVGDVEPLEVVGAQKALRLHCIREFGTRVAGEEYLFRGPGTYMPRVEEKIVARMSAVIIAKGEALRLRAKNKCVDVSGTERRAGEEWLCETAGPYLPNVDEEVVGTVKPVVLTPLKALHLKSVKTFTDEFGVKRNAGSEWLVTHKATERYLPGVHVQVVGHVSCTSLRHDQYAVVLNPVDGEGKPQLGKMSLRKGPATFFLQPGEELDGGVKDVMLLGDNEALLLKATEAFEDHQPGDLWMVQGPRSYVPPVQVRIMESRRAISLSRNEGVYVRDISTGKVRLISGQRYLLTAQEELWEKPLGADVEKLLQAQSGRPRVKTQAVTFRCPHNTAVRIYDYTTRKSRVVFGPNLVMLQPDEQITVWSLSGDEPKKPNHTKTLAISLGPEFMTDVFVVETSDHAKLRLKLAYNWFFDVDRDDETASQKIFSVPDFVGDLVKAIAGRVRGAVASQSFDAFHKNSARIIRTAAFGQQDRLVFPANNLVVTNVDVQSVEPVDQRTRDSLLNSVQKAISITTKSQEARARHLARQQEQDAKGLLDGQRLEDDSLAEKARAQLINLQTSTKIVEQTGEATAVAKAAARSREVEGQTEVVVAELDAEVARLRSTARLQGLKAKQDLQLDHKSKLDHEELRRESELAKIETEKFAQIVAAIDPGTIKAIAQAGPEMQARLLGGLGLKSVLISDGHSPLNLMSAAQGLLSE